jgi:DNA-binding transcriptional regulator YiaG
METYKNTDKQDLNNEIWISIKGYQNYYVSNLGRIKVKLKSGDELIKKQCFSNGYLVLGLTKNGKQKTARVHRIVAEEFVTKPKNKKDLEVNHIDNDKLNNSAQNLEWITHQENSQKVFSSKRRIIKVTPEIVKSIRVLKKEGVSQTNIAKQFNLSNGTISDIILNKKWHYV